MAGGEDPDDEDHVALEVEDKVSRLGGGGPPDIEDEATVLADEEDSPDIALQVDTLAMGIGGPAEAEGSPGTDGMLEDELLGRTPSYDDEMATFERDVDV